MAKVTIQTLPIEIRLQIWSYVVRPTEIYPCKCVVKQQQFQSHGLEPCCNNNSTYTHCDNRILRVSHQIYAEVQPLVKRAEKQRVFMFCDTSCLDNFFEALEVRDRKWIKHLRVDLFVGWGSDSQDDWFLCQMHRWAKRYVMGTLSKYGQGRQLTIDPAEEAKQVTGGRRMLTVDIYFT